MIVRAGKRIRLPKAPHQLHLHDRDIIHQRRTTAAKKKTEEGEEAAESSETTRTIRPSMAKASYPMLVRHVLHFLTFLSLFLPLFLTCLSLFDRSTSLARAAAR